MNYAPLVTLLLAFCLHTTTYASNATHHVKNIKKNIHKKTVVTHSAEKKKQCVEKIAPKKDVPKKKKLVLFISKGGFCHTAAGDTLRSFLGDEYDIEVLNPIQDLLHSIDPVKMFTFGKLDGEGFWNKMVQSGWVGTANWGAKHIAPTLILSKRRIIEKKVTEYLDKEMPDLVISLIPFLNRAFADASQKSNLPFLLITLDADLTTWLMGMHKITHQNYAVTIGSDLELAQQQLKNKKISPDHVHNIGYPIRDSFFEPHNKAAICKEWNIPTNKFIIMILMGGLGSYASYLYAKKIAAMNVNTHVLVCTGRNTAIADKIKKIKCTPGVSITTIPFTKKIADLMFVSNLFISKPGSGSVSEAVHMKLPMLLDSTCSALNWEQANLTLVKQHGWGDVVYKFKDLEPMIKKFVTDKKYYNNIKTNLKKEPPYRFNKKLKQLIKTLIKRQPHVAQVPIEAPNKGACKK